MKRILSVFGALCALSLSPGAGAQETGSFTETITFMDESRTLACYVPESYDPDIPARLMIALHGLGDNGTNYRNAWVTLLDFAGHIDNTILICPDGGSDLYSDFYMPEGDEGIIQASIDFATANYNIDTTNVILQGFSLGGARALQYGLGHTDKFKALLLNTPAIQGVKQAVTDYADGGLYDYENAANIPVYITHGSLDELYTAPIDSMYEQMVRHNGMVRLERFPIGHTIPDLEEMSGFELFFENLFLQEHDAELVKVTVPPRSCEATIPASVLVHNKGAETLTSVKMRYNWGGTDHAYTWSGSIAPFQHADIALPAITAGGGNHVLTVAIDSINGTPDTVSVNNNNTDSSEFRIAADRQALPYTQRFDDEGYYDSWLTLPSGDYILPFSFDEETQALICLNTIFVFDNAGRREEIASPVMDLASLENPYLTFDVAYSYVSYSADTFGVDTVFADTLEVFVSTDCGNTYESVYKKGGEDLLTFDSPIRNPLSLSASFIVPGSGDWRTERIDLAPFAASSEAVVKFSYKSALGGTIYLDNIAFVNEETGIPNVKQADITVYPNPARDKIWVHTANAAIRSVNICDATGRKVVCDYSAIPDGIEVNTGALINGLYIVEVITDKGRAIRKVVVNR